MIALFYMKQFHLNKLYSYYVRHNSPRGEKAWREEYQDVQFIRSLCENKQLMTYYWPQDSMNDLIYHFREYLSEVKARNPSISIGNLLNDENVMRYLKLIKQARSFNFGTMGNTEPILRSTEEMTPLFQYYPPQELQNHMFEHFLTFMSNENSSTVVMTILQLYPGGISF